jgi:hypothetical protein
LQDLECGEHRCKGQWQTVRAEAIRLTGVGKIAAKQQRISEGIGMV